MQEYNFCHLLAFYKTPRLQLTWALPFVDHRDANSTSSWRDEGLCDLRSTKEEGDQVSQSGLVSQLLWEYLFSLKAGSSYTNPAAALLFLLRLPHLLKYKKKDELINRTFLKVNMSW